MNETVGELLDRIERAIDDGEQKTAEALCSQVLSLDKDNVDARLYQAVLATMTGDVDRLLEVEQEILAREPGNVEARTFLAEAYLGVGLPERTVELCEPLLGEDKVEPHVLVLMGDAMQDLGYSDGAAQFYDTALQYVPGMPEAMVGLGVSLYEQLKLEEALTVLQTAVEADDTRADAHFFLGLVLERLDDQTGARRAFERARTLDPETYPAPLDLSVEEFEKVVEEVLTSLPPRLRDYLANVPISVAEIPSDEDLRAEDPPLSPSLWGLFRGQSLPEQIEDPWAHVPSEIVLYRGNLQRAVRTREELLEEIKITLQHEIAHYLGLDEEEVADLGLA